MKQQVGAEAQSEPNNPWRVAAAVAVAGAALALPAHESDGAKAVPHLKAIEISATATCVRPLAERSVEDWFRLAEECEQLRTVGHIAVVGVGVPLTALEEINNTTEALLESSSNGLISMQLDTFEYKPTDNGKQWQNSVEEKHCVGWDVAELVEDTMAGLDKYPAIVVVTRLPSCNAGVLGVSTGPRYAVVYGVGARADTGLVATTQAHEIYHSVFGMGHTGEEVERDANSHEVWNTIFDLSDPRLNIYEYLKGCEQHEYTFPFWPHKDVMGGGISHEPRAGMTSAPTKVDDYTLTPPQLNSLRWSDMFLNGNGGSKERAISDSWTTITPSEGLQGGYASIKLDEPLMLPMKITVEEDGKQVEKTIMRRFTSAAIMPPVAESSWRRDSDRFVSEFTQLLFVSENGETVVRTKYLPLTVHETRTDGGQRQESIRYIAYEIGNQRLEFRVSPQRFSVRAAATNVG